MITEITVLFPALSKPRVTNVTSLIFRKYKYDSPLTAVCAVLIKAQPDRSPSINLSGTVPHNSVSNS